MTSTLAVPFVVRAPAAAEPRTPIATTSVPAGAITYKAPPAKPPVISQVQGRYYQATVKSSAPPRIVFCEGCASNMAIERLAIDMFQLYCPTCGVAGPRKSTADEATNACVAIFSTK